MTVVLALPKLFDDVVALFQSESTSREAPIYEFAGTSVPTVDDASLPLGNFDVRVKITTAGTIGTPGITYQYSTDGGATWSTDQNLDSDDQIAVPGSGVIIDFSAGTVEVDDNVKVIVAKAAPVPQVFGWREKAKRTGKMRIVWVPGDDEKGDVGDILPARNPGREPRPIATLEEIFTVYIEGADLTAPENERAQYIAARLLFDAWLRAVHTVAHGTYTLETPTWVKPEQKERRYGATIRVLGTVQAMVPDAPHAGMPADAHAVLTDSLLDVSEENDTSNT